MLIIFEANFLYIFIIPSKSSVFSLRINRKTFLLIFRLVLITSSTLLEVKILRRISHITIPAEMEMFAFIVRVALFERSSELLAL